MVSSPWVRLAQAARAPVAPDTTVSRAPVPVRTPGPSGPQPSLDRPARRLPHRPIDQPGRFVLGAHGGAAESLVAQLLSWESADHAWPRPAPEAKDSWPFDSTGCPKPSLVVVTCRSDHAGLEAARNACREWAAATVPTVRLLGLVVVADAPGRLPRPLATLARVVVGGYPRSWRMPWLPLLRLGSPVDNRDPAVRGLVDQIAAAAAALSATSSTSAPPGAEPTAAGAAAPAAPAARPGSRSPSASERSA